MGTIRPPATPGPLLKKINAGITKIQAGGKANVGRAPIAYGLAGLALAGAWWMAQDSKAGINQKQIDNSAAIREHAEWQDMMFDKGHFSSNPWFDAMAHKLYRLYLRGPMDLRIHWQEFTQNTGEYLGSVIGKNALPLGLASIAGYVALGPQFVNLQLLKGMRGLGMFCKNNLSWVPKKIGQAVSAVAPKVASRSGGILRWMFGNPVGFAISAGTALFGWFFVQRLQDSYGHDAQDDFFREGIVTRHSSGGGH